MMSLVRDLTLMGGAAMIAVFAGAYETALMLASRSRLEEMLDESFPDSERPTLPFLKAILENDPRVRLSINMLHAVALTAFILVGARLCFSGEPHALGFDWKSAEGVLCALGLLFCSALLRAGVVAIGGNEEEELICNGARAAAVLAFPFRPVAWLVRKMFTVIARSLGRKTEMSEEERREELEDEVIAAVSDGELDGVVEEEQREMIEGIFDFKNSDVADVFTPRTEMISIESTAAVSEAISVALEHGFSRLPVHEGTRDNIVGVFYVREALRYWGHEQASLPPLVEMLHKPLFVPETKNVPDLLKEMQQGETHIAIVLDEYGGTAGLVTIEDVIEEIVGEIQDEYDTAEVEEEIRKIDENTIVAEANAHVSDINEALDMDVIPEDDDYETLAGFVLDQLGHIPETGETLEHKSLRIKVLAADERRVERVQVYRDPDAEEE